jgi:threonine/homoserine/homoserine lactone efflux protein
MSAIDSLTTGRGFLLGFVLAAVNPKNLLLAVAGGYAIGGGGLSVGEIVVVILVFVVIAASTVLIPVLAFLIAGDRAKGPLTNMRVWLVANNATIMAILLLVIGVALIGKGIGSF